MCACVRACVHAYVRVRVQSSCAMRIAKLTDILACSVTVMILLYITFKKFYH